MKLFRREDDWLPPLPEDETEAAKPRRERRPFRIGQGVQVVAVFILAFGAALVCAMTVVVPRLLAAPELAPPRAADRAGGSPDAEAPTARQAYVPAVELIRETDPAAQLATAVGAWTPTVDRAALRAGRTGWTFYFYLPDSGEMGQVVVNRDLEAHLLETQPWAAAPELLTDQRWRTDSPDAAGPLLDVCGDALAGTEGASATIRLTTAAENRTLLWYGQVTAPDEVDPVCEVTVDALTGLPR
jgi:hypothetical protein